MLCRPPNRLACVFVIAVRSNLVGHEISVGRQIAEVENCACFRRVRFFGAVVGCLKTDFFCIRPWPDEWKLIFHDFSSNIIMPGDQRKVYGETVHALATHVTSLTECNRRYGSNNKKTWLDGVVIRVENTKTKTGRLSCLIVAVYKLGSDGGSKTKASNHGVKINLFKWGHGFSVNCSFVTPVLTPVSDEYPFGNIILPITQKLFYNPKCN